MTTLASPAAPGIATKPLGESLVAVLSGSWTAEWAETCEQALAGLLGGPGKMGRIVLNLSHVERLDTVGAWILDRTRDRLARNGHRVDVVEARASFTTLLDEVAAHGFHRASPRPEGRFPLLVGLGKGVVDATRNIGEGLSFLGEVVVATTRFGNWRHHFRLAAFVHQMELIGLRGVPIIVLISFLVGCIVAQQGVFQLRRFGGVPFVVDLVGILSLRELGLLLTAIMVAGRSGSSFTAELGSMKMREEIDALKVMGFDPIDVLIIPRLFALIVALPMLTFLADMAALYGGGLVAWLYGDISPAAFMARLKEAIGLNTLMVGLIKAPFMAAVIGIVASIEGLAVAGSAESLGRRVTSSVVKAIFMVIVADGLFAIFFAAIRY